ncbi:MAG: glycosyltransferase family 9 protein [Bdellovibrionia bacterium]
MNSANLIVQTAFLGDLLLSIPLLKNVRKLWPEQQLLLVCRKGFGEYFVKLGLIDKAIEIKKGDNESYKQALRELQEFQIQHVISPHQSLRTSLFVARIHAQQKVSFKNFHNFLMYSTRVKRQLDLPDAIRQLSLLQPFSDSLTREIQSYQKLNEGNARSDSGYLSNPPQWASMSVREHLLFAQEPQELLERLFITKPNLKKTVAIFPGSVWATKRWTTEGFKAVAKDLLNENFNVLVMGGPGEEELCAEVASADSRIQNICGKTKVLESAQILAHCYLALGNDSASMHLAASVDLPIVSIFGPTVLDLGYRPWGKQVQVIERADLKCRPCGKHGHHKCPLGTHECMKSISPQTVVAAIHHHSSV